MSFTTVDILTREMKASVLAALSDDENATPDIADPETIAVIEQAINSAAAHIRLNVNHTLDVSDPVAAADLQVLNNEIALYLLWERRGYGHDGNPKAGAFERAMETLKRIGRREAFTSRSPQHPASGIRSASNDQVFTDTALDGM